MRNASNFRQKQEYGLSNDEGLLTLFNLEECFEVKDAARSLLFH